MNNIFDPSDISVAKLWEPIMTSIDRQHEHGIIRVVDVLKYVSDNVEEIEEKYHDAIKRGVEYANNNNLHTMSVHEIKRQSEFKKTVQFYIRYGFYLYIISKYGSLDKYLNIVHTIDIDVSAYREYMEPILSKLPNGFDPFDYNRRMGSFSAMYIHNLIVFQMFSPQYVSSMANNKISGERIGYLLKWYINNAINGVDWNIVNCAFSTRFSGYTIYTWNDILDDVTHIEEFGFIPFSLKTIRYSFDKTEDDFGDVILAGRKLKQRGKVIATKCLFGNLFIYPKDVNLNIVFKNPCPLYKLSGFSDGCAEVRGNGYELGKIAHVRVPDDSEYIRPPE